MLANVMHPCSLETQLAQSRQECADARTEVERQRRAAMVTADAHSAECSQLRGDISKLEANAEVLKADVDRLNKSLTLTRGQLSEALASSLASGAALRSSVQQEFDAEKAALEQQLTLANEQLMV